MSFILDALKKSENERQRQIGPSLADVKVVRRHAERPWWVVAVAALLVVNLGVLLFVLIRGGNARPAPAQPAAQPPAQSAPPQNSYAPPPQGAQQNYYTQPQATPRYQSPAPAAQGYRSPPAAMDPSVRSLADEAGGEEPYPDEPMNPSLAGAASVPEGPPIVRQIEAPAVAPLPSGAVFEARTSRNQNQTGVVTNNETLPTLNDLAASGTSLPDLHLDIHVHSQQPNERFVFVNMRKYLEGETLKEGPSVERITPEGVVLNQRGLRFLLPRE